MLIELKVVLILVNYRETAHFSLISLANLSLHTIQSTHSPSKLMKVLNGLFSYFNQRNVTFSFSQ